ncbi:MAG: glutathione S-transferase [Janthinobacterium lividum]
MIELFEVCGENPLLVFSPFCWRVRLALAHKGLSASFRPVTYSDKDQIAFSGQDLLPIIRDGDTQLHDSFAIIRYLDQQYPHAALGLDSLAGSRAELIDRTAHQDLLVGLFRLLVLRILPLLSPQDADYFRNKHEQLLGITLEAFADLSIGQQLVDRALQPLEAQLQSSPFLDGKEPGAVDILIGGFFFWAWVLHSTPWEHCPSVSEWFGRMLTHYESVRGNICRAPLPEQLAS